MSLGPPQPEDVGNDYVVMPTPQHGKGTYGIYSKKKSRFIFGMKGMSKKEAKETAKKWKKGEKK